MSRDNIQRDGPKSIPPEKMDEETIVTRKALLAYWQLSEYDLIVPFGVMSFQHSLLYEGKRWWRSVNREGGWAVVDNGKEAVSQSVMTLIETVRGSKQSVTFPTSPKRKDGIARTSKTRWNMRPLEFTNCSLYHQ
jgi:hypothetical protein